MQYFVEDVHSWKMVTSGIFRKLSYMNMDDYTVPPVYL